MTSIGTGTGRSGALVSGRGHLSWLDTIRANLSVDNWIQLNKSCFGHFFSIPDIQFQGQLYHALIKKLDKSSLPRQRLCFRINNKVIEFGPREFTAITGLRMHGWEEPPTDSAFHENYFGGRTDLVFCDIQKSFVRECEATGGNSVEALKLALLYILYGILLIRARKSKTIDLKYFHLIDDLEKFNMYAWGQVSYEFLMRTAHRARDILDNLIAEGKTLAYDANGFALALQTWAYEVMPNLARGCAMRVPGMEDQSPRMLRWASSKHCRFHRINKYFNAKNAGEFPVALVLSDQEEQALISLGVNDITSGPLSLSLNEEVIYKHRRLPKKSYSNASKRLRNGNVPGANRQSERLQGHCGNDASVEGSSPIVSALAQRVATLERTVKVLQSSGSDATAPDDIASFPTDEPPLHNIRRKRPAPCKRVVQTRQTFPRCEFDLDAVMLALLHPQPHSRRRSARASLPNIVPSRSSVYTDVKHRAAAKPTQPSHSIPKAKSVRKNNVIEPSVRPVIPHTIVTRSQSAISCPSDDLEVLDEGENAALAEFACWYRKSIRQIQSEIITLPTGVHADAVWFSYIWRRRGWLRDDHIDSLLNLVLFNLKESGKLIGDCAAMEIVCWRPLIGDTFENIVHFVGPYACGLYPKCFPVRWHRAKRVFGVGIISKHWVAYEISLEAQCIKVYDSLSQTNSWDSVLKAFHNMSFNIPKLIEHLRIWDEKHLPGPMHRVWDIISIRRPPQQHNNFDCGIMVIKYLECLLGGCDLSVLDSDRCELYRRLYCASLYSTSNSGV